MSANMRIHLSSKYLASASGIVVVLVIGVLVYMLSNRFTRSKIDIESVLLSKPIEDKRSVYELLAQDDGTKVDVARAITRSSVERQYHGNAWIYLALHSSDNLSGELAEELYRSSEEAFYTDEWEWVSSCMDALGLFAAKGSTSATRELQTMSLPSTWMKLWRTPDVSPDAKQDRADLISYFAFQAYFLSLPDLAEAKSLYLLRLKDMGTSIDDVEILRGIDLLFVNAHDTRRRLRL